MVRYRNFYIRWVARVSEDTVYDVGALRGGVQTEKSYIISSIYKLNSDFGTLPLTYIKCINLLPVRSLL